MASPYDFPTSSLGRSPPITASSYRSPSTRSLASGFATTMTQYGGSNTGGTTKERDLAVQVMQKDSKIRVSGACSLDN
jgi:hypothetical protein